MSILPIQTCHEWPNFGLNRSTARYIMYFVSCEVGPQHINLSDKIFCKLKVKIADILTFVTVLRRAMGKSHVIVLPGVDRTS